MNLMRCLLIAVTAAPILARNKNDTYDECREIIRHVAEDDIYFNSTGSTSFNFPGQKDLWHLSMATFFHLARNTSQVRDVSSTGDRVVFLSVPQSLIGSVRGNNTEVCYYQMDPVNATSNADDDESCNGILSEKCQEALLSAGGPANGLCPRLNIDDDCGKAMRLWTTKPLNFSSSECSVDKLPGVRLPMGYRTFSIMSAGYDLPPEEDGFLDAYDLMVRQPLPIVLAARVPGQNKMAVEIACVAPDNITADSRVPDSEFPPSGAGDLNVRATATFAMAVACIVGVIFV
ncbi:hypothetical protein LCI18_013929 [Fusarium solani-melongenae]|uniref:Uncharacterized protein n=1 Tax=Fusarium solani subsp. cucurbitae TaxID=2747967 RepID=A0ACD3ZNX9_FUSSC|nr:hypothetical protein LCI18_013929 [Fusarium solani-melongenae]